MRALLFGMVSAAVLPMWAAPVDADQAMAEALEFLNSNPAGMRHLPAASSSAAPALSLASTRADASQQPLYYIFNSNSNGYVIISADDRLPAVLGYSDSGAFDEKMIPDNMKWWLSQYAEEIERNLPSLPEAGEKRPLRVTSKRAPISPMLTTQWNQDAPFNNDCPADRTGNKSMTGCVATATAQIMNYHEWPLRPTGGNNGVIFNGTTYDWANMADLYESGKYTSAQAAAVSKLMYHVGVAVNMQYSSYGSGAYDYDVPVALSKYFGYSQGVRMMWRNYTPLTQWTETIYSELAAGRPVYYSGSSSEGGHAFVCDGYSENDYFHFNWGWGGYEDGYFLLTALNPASGGIGAFNGGYNTAQSILVGIQPSSNNPDASQQIALLSMGSFVWLSGEEFGVADDPANFNIIYNPLAYTINFTLGLRVENLKDPSDVQYLSVERVSLESYYGFTGFSHTLPEMADGDYRLYPVMSASTNPTSASDWEDILIPLGYQNYVALHVENGVKSFANEGPDADNTPNLIVGRPITVSRLWAGTPSAFILPVVNVGSGDYIGRLGFSLFDADDEFGDVASWIGDVAIGGNTSANVAVTLPDGLSAGRYNLYVMDMNSSNFSDTLLEGLTYTYQAGDFSQPVVNSLSATNLAPNHYIAGTEGQISFKIKNSAALGARVGLGFEFLDINTLQRVGLAMKSDKLAVPGNVEIDVNSSLSDFGLQPGSYLWRVVNDAEEPLSLPTPLIVESASKVAEGVTYVVTNEAAKQARLTAPVGDVYTGTVVVPSSVNGYTITSMANDAFTFSTASDVTLPASLGLVPAGAFYNDESLAEMRVPAGIYIRAERNAFNPTTVKNCWLNVSPEDGNQYMTMQEWWRMRVPFWSIRLENCSITGGLELNPATSLPYNPYCVGASDTPVLSFAAPAGYNICLLCEIDGVPVHGLTFDPLTTTVTLPPLEGRHQGWLYAYATMDQTSVADVESEPIVADIYTVDGLIVKRNATEADFANLPAGLYIHAGKKVRIVR